jgi:hypothetical protein
MVFFKGTATVPYVGTFHYKDGTSETYSGTWSGVAVLDEQVKITVLNSNICGKLILAEDNGDMVVRDIQAVEEVSNMMVYLVASIAAIAFILLLVAIKNRKSTKLSADEHFISAIKI